MAKGARAQLRDLEKKLEDKILSAMLKEVGEAVTKEGINQVEETVYSYEPKVYERKKKDGGLSDERNWDREAIHNGVKVWNTRTENGRNIPEIIETGEGYEYTGYGYEYEEPRPFIENTRESLRRDKAHVEALKEGLKRQGIESK